MNIIDSYNYIDPISAQLFTPQRTETNSTSTSHDTVSISDEARVLFANSQNIQQGETAEKDKQEYAENESYTATAFKKAMQWNSVNSDDDLTEEEKQRKIQEEILKKQSESLGNTVSTQARTQSSIIPASLDNFAPTGDEENAMPFFMPSIVQENMPHISELPTVGAVGGGMKMQELLDRGNDAWNAYTQAMNELGLEDSVTFAQSEEFSQWRDANPELAQELDARSKAIFNQMA